MPDTTRESAASIDAVPGAAGDLLRQVRSALLEVMEGDLEPADFMDQYLVWALNRQDYSGSEGIKRREQHDRKALGEMLQRLETAANIIEVYRRDFGMQGETVILKVKEAGARPYHLKAEAFDPNMVD